MGRRENQAQKTRRRRDDDEGNQHRVGQEGQDDAGAEGTPGGLAQAPHLPEVGRTFDSDGPSLAFGVETGVPSALYFS